MSEPMTFVTDLLITAACVVCGGLLHTRVPDRRSRRQWQWFFGTLGVATALGGTGHLLSGYTGQRVLLASWLVGGVAIFLFEIVSISLVATAILRRTLHGVVTGKLAAFVVYSMVSRRFIGVVVDGALGLVFIVAVIHVANIARSRSAGSLWIVVGIVLAALAALAHTLHLAISERWFNHNDVGHVILVVSLLAICRGAIRAQPAP